MVTATATATTMTAITTANNGDIRTTTTAVTTTTTTTSSAIKIISKALIPSSNTTTCNFSATHKVYRSDQQQQELSANNKFYSLPQRYDMATNATTETAPSPKVTCLATFNGNLNVNIGNGSINCVGGDSCSGNDGSNITNVTNSNAAMNCNKSETSSNTDNIIGGSGRGNGNGGPVSPTSSIKKKVSSNIPPLDASREDITSLCCPSSLNINQNSGGNVGSNDNNHISSLKGSKDNLLHNYNNDNDTGDGAECIDGIASAMRNIEVTDDPGDGLGPLPFKWETAYTERGELYFIDHNTGTSHWLDPRLSKYQKKSLEDCGDDELPYGWEKIEDSLYGTYYIDHVNRRTQYENPVLEAKRRAAERKEKQTKLQRPQTPLTQSDDTIGDRIDNNSVVGRRKITKLNFGTHLLHTNMNMSQNCMQPPPPLPLPPSFIPYKFTRNPTEILGERITTTLTKSARGLGITIVGGDDGVEEFLQIKSIVPKSPAWVDGQLQTGDILVYVNDTCVLGCTHHEMVKIFQSILAGDDVTLEICRGYSLPFDPNDPNTEVVTTMAVDGVGAILSNEQRRYDSMDPHHMDGNYTFLDMSCDEKNEQIHHHEMTACLDAKNSGFILMKKPDVHVFSIVKGTMGFGFTIADSAYGQKVKKILDRNCCTHLQEGDILLDINDVNISNKSHLEVVQILKDCSKTHPTTVKIQRGLGSNVMGSIISPRVYDLNANMPINNSGNVSNLKKNFIGLNGVFRSKTPTAELYSTQQKEVLPIRPKTPIVDTRRERVKTPNNELNDVVVNIGGGDGNLENSLVDSKSLIDAKSTNSLHEIEEISFMDPYPKLVTSFSERLVESKLLGDNVTLDEVGGEDCGTDGRRRMGLTNANTTLRSNYENQEHVTSSNHSDSYNPIYGLTRMPPTMGPINPMQSNNNMQPYLSQSNNQTMAQLYSPSTPLNLVASIAPMHHESCYCYECQDYKANKVMHQQPQSQTIPYRSYDHHQLPPSSDSLNPLSSHYHSQYSPYSLHSTPLHAAHIQNERMQKRVNELLNDRRKVGFTPLDTHHHSTDYNMPSTQHSPAISSISQQMPLAWVGTTTHVGSTSLGVTPTSVVAGAGIDTMDDSEQYELTKVTLERQALGFGFRIVGGTEEGSQVTVGHIVPGGAAHSDHRITTGDEILSIDGINVVNSSHHKVVSLMGEAALRGQVTMILRRRIRSSHQLPSLSPHEHTLSSTLRMPQQRYPYDVIVNRHENEGFGFVIISSNQYYGSTIGKLILGSPADRCGELKVGDHIIAVNRIDIAGMTHGDVVNLIKESGLHVRLTIGCPKEVAGGVNTLLITSAQASPEQISQTQLVNLAPAPTMTHSVPSPHLSTLRQQQLAQQEKPLHRQLANEVSLSCFERSATSNVTAYNQQQPQQKHHDQLAAPSQL